MYFGKVLVVISAAFAASVTAQSTITVSTPVTSTVHLVSAHTTPTRTPTPSSTPSHTPSSSRVAISPSAGRNSTSAVHTSSAHVSPVAPTSNVVLTSTLSSAPQPTQSKSGAASSHELASVMMAGAVVMVGMIMV